MVTAQTITYGEEAIGLVAAARDEALPLAVSFTVETDGRLPSGEPLDDAIRRVDAATERGAAYFMINCAHPDHFRDVVTEAGDWSRRLRGVRANASRLSHAELDAADSLDDGDPAELGRDYRALQQILPQLNVLGGCCGTDHRHIEAIARRCAVA